MKSQHENLLKIGETIKQEFEKHGFDCTTMRPWNSDYEISLSKGGNFSVAQQEIKNILQMFGFIYTTQMSQSYPYMKVTLHETIDSFYVNFNEDIGCFIEKHRHHIILFSDCRETMTKPSKPMKSAPAEEE